MQKYDGDTFRRYYSNSYILHPDFPNQVCRLVLDRQRNALLVVNSNTVIRTSADYAKCPVLDHSILEWEHVRRPTLGYRHVKDGKHLFFAEVMRRSDIPKGLHEHVIHLTVPDEFNTTVMKLGDSAYNPQLNLDFNTATELHFPNFIKDIPTACQMLIDDPQAIGLAISPSVAVVLGSTAKEAFYLLCDGSVVATSSDGKDWTYLDNYFEGMVERHAN